MNYCDECRVKAAMVAAVRDDKIIHLCFPCRDGATKPKKPEEVA